MFKKTVSFILVFSIMILGSCSADKDEPFKDYRKACKNVVKQDSYTRSENVKIDLSMDGYETTFNIKSKLESVTDEKDVSYSYNIGTDKVPSFATFYYKEGSIYVNSSFGKLAVKAPKVLLKPELLSFSKNDSDKNLISSIEEVVDGNRVITFYFAGKDAGQYLEMLANYGVGNIDLNNISTNNIKVVVKLDQNGLILSEQIYFEAVGEVFVDGVMKRGVLQYRGDVAYSKINDTTIVFPDLSGHAVVGLDNLKELLESLNINLF